MLSSLKRQYVAEAQAENNKLSNVDADDMAHADPEYNKWLEKKRLERREMHRLMGDLAVVRAEIEAAILDKELIDRTLRLQEEMIRWGRSEMRLS